MLQIDILKPPNNSYQMFNKIMPIKYLINIIKNYFTFINNFFKFVSIIKW